MKLHKSVEPRDNLEIAFKQCRRSSDGGSLYAAFIDGNRIKRVNDKYGHLIGDKVIERISTAIGENVRRGDRVIRYGGDEFVVFLVNIKEKHLPNWVARIQKCLNHDEWLCKTVGTISVSVGIAKYDHTTHRSLEDFLSEADKKMYEHKRSTQGIIGFINRILQRVA